MAGTGLAVKQPADDSTGTGLAAKTAGRRSDRHRPCSKTQPADEVVGTGLAVKQPADDPTSTGLAAKQPADEVGRPLALFNGGWWRECGGAGHSEGGLGPTLLSPSQPIAFACLCPYPLP